MIATAPPRFAHTVLQCVVAVWCCSVLQCVVVCRSVSQCVAVCCRRGRSMTTAALPTVCTQCVAVCCSVLQCVVCCSVLQAWRLNDRNKAAPVRTQCVICIHISTHSYINISIHINIYEHTSTYAGSVIAQQRGPAQ